MLRRDLLLLFVLAVSTNFGAASFIHAPGYVDDAYYYGSARRLVQGYGFTEPYLWNYLGNPPSLPQPSHLYWMPLTSIVAAASMSVFGQSFAMARLPLVVIASLLPLMAYYSAFRISSIRRHALGAGLLAVFSGFYPALWGTTDSFALYALVGSLALLAIGQAKDSGDWRLEIGAGIVAGLAHLTRADGVLLLAVGGWLLAVGGWRAANKRLSFFVVHGSLLMTGYLLVMAPWLARNVIVAGSPLGRGGAGTLWLVEYNDLFNYPANLTPARYFASGWQAILAGKWEALVANLQTILGVQCLIFLAPLVVLGMWRLRRHALCRPAFLYAALLYVTMTFAFSFPGARGGLFHSGIALMPFYFTACFTGLDTAIDWIASRLKHWQPERAKANFSILAIAGAAVLTLVLTASRLRGWNGGDSRFHEIGAAIPREAVVMSNNPPGLWVATGHPGIPLVNGGVHMLLAAADQFDTRYVLLDHNLPAGLAGLYDDEAGERLTLVGRWDEWKLFEVAR